jgi:hypothetical protein
MAANRFGIFGTNHELGSHQPSFAGKVVLWICILVSLMVMSWLTGVFSIPNEPGFSASLLQEDHWLVSLFVIAVGMLIVMFASAVLGSSLRTDAPVFCTALGCGVISWRGGTMQTTLFAASGPGLFFTLAFETVLLFAMFAACWQLLAEVRGRTGAVSPGEPAAEESSLDESSLDEKLLATFTQAAAMMALMILLCRDDAKNQVLASVGISSALGAAIAMQFVNVRSSFWLWIGPLAVALFGYVFTAFHAEGWQIGVLHGPLAALARPLPLDYLCMGPAGAIFGYWLSSTGSAEDELPDAEAAPSN